MDCDALGGSEQRHHEAGYEEGSLQETEQVESGG